MDQQSNHPLDAFWMPFSDNKYFKQNPRLLAEASGMYYRDVNGRQILDGTAGLWCVNAGHCRTQITEAIQKTAATLDYAPTFNLGHPLAFKLAEELAAIFPVGLDQVFFTNSGSESVDTALKIALAYHRACGEGTRTRFIGRTRGYHGVGFGGISVGGLGGNRLAFAAMLPGTDHLPDTHDLQKNAYSRGCPDHGADRADALEGLIALHGAENIAAVIVEPLAGSAGVLVPPIGYLERLRAITAKHGILLIFDEVITAFGRCGGTTASDVFGIQPDIITCAKGLTNGAVPMGAVVVKGGIYDAVINKTTAGIELFHGYTYSGHPLAAAAGLATLQVYKDERLFERAQTLSSYWEQAIHSLKGRPHIIDIRNYGLVAGIELEPREGAVGARAQDIFRYCFDNGLLIRVTGDIIALSPPLIIETSEIDSIVHMLDEALHKVM